MSNVTDSGGKIGLGSRRQFDRLPFPVCGDLACCQVWPQSMSRGLGYVGAGGRGDVVRREE